MKEFVAETGGRYIYNDDLINLQDLSLSLTHLFDGCENMIISGCEVSGPRISSGYVYLNGKICQFSETLADAFPAYIVSENTVENVGYVDYGDKAGVQCYGCKLTYSPVGESIAIHSDGSAIRLEDGFFNRYALTLHAKTPQTVRQEVVFERNVSVGSLSTGVINGDRNGILDIKASRVNIPGVLMLNGHNVDEYFVPVELYRAEIMQCVKKSDSIQIFVDQAGGGTAGQKKVCETIGAAYQETVSGAFKEVANQLLDVGADTDWIDFQSDNITGKARQVGHVVSVVGDVTGDPSPDLFVSYNFQLPRGIAYPAYTIIQNYDNKNYCRVQIGGKLTRDETSASPGTHFNVTYLV